MCYDWPRGNSIKNFGAKHENSWWGEYFWSSTISLVRISHACDNFKLQSSIVTKIFIQNMIRLTIRLWDNSGLDVLQWRKKNRGICNVRHCFKRIFSSLWLMDSFVGIFVGLFRELRNKLEQKIFESVQISFNCILTENANLSTLIVPFNIQNQCLESKSFHKLLTATTALSDQRGACDKPNYKCYRPKSFEFKFRDVRPSKVTTAIKL